jgi:Tfp pilus assembly protein PilP
LNILVQSDTTQKIELLETYKTETLSLLNNIRNDKTEDGVNKAIEKIKEMMYSGNSNERQRIDEDIIKLHELKKDLL